MPELLCLDEYNFQFVGQIKTKTRQRGSVLAIPAALPVIAPYPALCVSPLFLSQDTVNALSYLLGFFHFRFQRKIPLVERISLGGQLGILRFPCFCRNGVLPFITPLR